jgi:hypothetical protein
MMDDRDEKSYQSSVISHQSEKGEHRTSNPTSKPVQAGNQH